MTGTVSTPGAEAPKDHWHLRLYVAGQSPKSLRALANLQELCEEHLPGRYEIELVDVADDPQRAIEDDVVAVPTLVRSLPAPIRKIIGDLSDTNRVLVTLRVPSDDTP